MLKKPEQLYCNAIDDWWGDLVNFSKHLSSIVTDWTQHLAASVTRSFFVLPHNLCNTFQVLLRWAVGVAACSRHRPPRPSRPLLCVAVPSLWSCARIHPRMMIRPRMTRMMMMMMKMSVAVLFFFPLLFLVPWGGRVGEGDMRCHGMVAGLAGLVCLALVVLALLLLPPPFACAPLSQILRSSSAVSSATPNVVLIAPCGYSTRRGTLPRRAPLVSLLLIPCGDRRCGGKDAMERGRSVVGSLGDSSWVERMLVLVLEPMQVPVPHFHQIPLLHLQ